MITIKRGDADAAIPAPERLRDIQNTSTNIWCSQHLNYLSKHLL